MKKDEKTRKPLHTAAEAAGTPAVSQRALLTEREKRLLQIIREGEDPITLLMVALGAAADCLKQLEQSEQLGPGLCGVIDKNGNQILPCAYEYVGAYRNGCFIISRFMRESSRDYYRQTNSLTQPDRDNMEDALVSAHGNELIPFGRYDSIVFSGDYVQGGTWTGRYKGSLTPDVDKIYHYSDSFQISDLLAEKGGTAPVEPLSPIKPSTGTTSSTEMPSVSVQFKDVCGSDYYADAVLWAVEKNITSGTSATTFSPGTTCSKAQILTFLWRANGLPEPIAANPFTDIKNLLM